MLPPIPDNLDKEQEEQYLKAWWKIFYLVKGLIQFVLIGVCLVFMYTLFDLQKDLDRLTAVRTISTVSSPSAVEEDWDRIENGVHVLSGLYVDDNFELVRANCTACHSGKLISQNRATRAGWQQMIRWMQETQGLWELGDKEPRILDYLEKHYAPQETGRRAHLNIDEIEWYILNVE